MPLDAMTTKTTRVSEASCKDRPQPARDVGSDLLALLEDPDMSDITLIAGDRQFYAHRCILMARCDYFRAMFKVGLSDSSAKEVNLHEADPDALALLLIYIYSGILAECPHGVLGPSIALADMLLLPCACAKLQERLLGSTSAGSIVDDMLWAEQAGYADLLSKMEEAYVSQHAHSVDDAAVMRLAEGSPKLMARLHLTVQKSLNSLTTEAKAAVVEEVSALLEERDGDEPAELQELQHVLHRRGFFIAADAVEAYLVWMSAHHDQELAEGNELPDIAYDGESKMFSRMVS